MLVKISDKIYKIYNLDNLFLRQMKYSKDDEANSLIYSHPLKHEPTRYEIVRYSTWRVYFFQELEAMSSDKIADLKNGQNWI